MQDLIPDLTYDEGTAFDDRIRKILKHCLAISDSGPTLDTQNRFLGDYCDFDGSYCIKTPPSQRYHWRMQYAVYLVYRTADSYDE